MRLSRQMMTRVIPASAAVAVVLAGASTYFCLNRRFCARREHSLGNHLKRIDKALAQFKQTCGRYPLTREGLMALSKKPSGIPCPAFPIDGFLSEKQVKRDPWGSSYLYSSQGDSFVLKSLGADGRPGGEGLARDRGFSELGMTVSVEASSSDE